MEDIKRNKSPVYALVLDDLHVAVRAALIRVGVQFAQREHVEGQLDEVPVWPPGSHQRQVAHGRALRLQRPQHLQLVRLAHRAVVEAVTLCRGEEKRDGCSFLCSCVYK